MSEALAEGDPVLDWSERGELVQVLPLLHGGLRVAAMVDLTPAACEALVHGLDAWAQGRGFIPHEVHEALLERLGHTEEQLDQRDDALTELRRELRERVGEVEQLKSALDLADQRVRALEVTR